MKIDWNISEEKKKKREAWQIIKVEDGQKWAEMNEMQWLLWNHQDSLLNLLQSVAAICNINRDLFVTNSVFKKCSSDPSVGKSERLGRLAVCAVEQFITKTWFHSNPQEGNKHDTKGRSIILNDWSVILNQWPRRRCHDNCTTLIWIASIFNSSTLRFVG